MCCDVAPLMDNLMNILSSALVADFVQLESIFIARSTSLTINRYIETKQQICLSLKAISIEQNLNIAGNVYLNKLNSPLYCLFTFLQMCCSLEFDALSQRKIIKQANEMSAASWRRKYAEFFRIVQRQS